MIPSPAALFAGGEGILRADEGRGCSLPMLPSPAALFAGGEGARRADEGLGITHHTKIARNIYP